MTTTRRRRIVRWALVAPLGAMVLLVSYLAGYGTFNWHYGRQLRLRTLPALQTPSVFHNLFTPLYLYETTDWIGARTLSTWRNWCLNKGGETGQTWEQCWLRSEEDHKALRRASRSSVRQ